MKKKMVLPQPVNLLQDVHSRMVNLPIYFRDRVCDECSWSIPTFYRKMRIILKPGSNKEKISPNLSNAEKEKIIAIADELYRSFWGYCEKYRKNKSRTI